MQQTVPILAQASKHARTRTTRLTHTACTSTGRLLRWHLGRPSMRYTHFGKFSNQELQRSIGAAAAQSCSPAHAKAAAARHHITMALREWLDSDYASLFLASEAGQSRARLEQARRVVAEAEAVLELRELGLKSAMRRSCNLLQADTAPAPASSARPTFAVPTMGFAKSSLRTTTAPTRPRAADVRSYAQTHPPKPKRLASHLEPDKLDNYFALELRKGPLPQDIPFHKRFPPPPPKPPPAKPPAPPPPLPPARPMSKGRSAAAARRPIIDGPRLSPAVVARPLPFSMQSLSIPSSAFVNS